MPRRNVNVVVGSASAWEGKTVSLRSSARRRHRIGCFLVGETAKEWEKQVRKRREESDITDLSEWRAPSATRLFLSTVGKWIW